VLSRLPPLVLHRRVGRYGQAFWTFKLRTMWTQQCSAFHLHLWERIVDGRGPELKQSGDPRVCSWFARFCRRHSIDELPQLINVVRGEMALVGPRPLTPEELRDHYGPEAAEVLRMRPGITGLWQVSGRSRLSYPERREMDLLLVRNRSLKLYGSILLRTVPEVLGGRNSW
jgi:exopolysaccharide production protein ExoY